jgi:long-subunit fatty acid transport protein
LRLAVFRHELIAVEQDFTSRGAFYSRGFDVRETAYSAFRTLTVDTYGGSVAFDARPVWVGAGVLAHRFSLGFEFDRFAHETFYGGPDLRQSVFHFSQDGDDIAIGMVAGVLVPISSAKIGLAYKRAPRFGFSSLSSFPGLFGSQQRTSAQFKVPDMVSVGFSTAFATNFLITAEYSRVFHSQLLTDYVDVLVNQGESRTRADRFTIDDAGEVHVGVEYLLATALRPAIRAGFWFDPDHSVHFAPTPANDLPDERFAASLSSGRDLWHYTFGTMVSVHPRLDISVGVDHSSRSTLVSTSANIRF